MVQKNHVGKTLEGHGNPAFRWDPTATPRVQRAPLPAQCACQPFPRFPSGPVSFRNSVINVGRSAVRQLS